MPSPFPGMDPFVENLGIWRDFQLGLLGCCRRALNSALPKKYIALVDEEVKLEAPAAAATVSFRPDVSVVGTKGPVARPQARDAGSGVALLEPTIVPLALVDLEPVVERWLEIRRLPERTLVTVIEVLSATNKSGAGRSQYLEKRSGPVEQPVHLVEIDLLVEGRRPPMAKPLPRGDYYAIVSRTGARHNSDVYAWSVRECLPNVPIPLLEPDADIYLDLADVCASTYEWGRYDDLIDYGTPLTISLAPDDLAWAQEIALARARMSGSG